MLLKLGKGPNKKKKCIKYQFLVLISVYFVYELFFFFSFFSEMFLYISVQIGYQKSFIAKKMGTFSSIFLGNLMGKKNLCEHGLAWIF